ncbi:GNAT family N-acetyltransferase [bacterium]|nr:GNAT family N-acetyltransferase [bacterium]
MIRREVDRARIREFCLRDPARYAFYLGDLDEAEWDNSRFFAREVEGEIDELMLIYLGLSLPSVQLFGRLGSLGESCLQFTPHLPEQFHLHCHNEDVSLLMKSLDLAEGGELFRMHWRGYPKELRPSVASSRILGTEDLPDLCEFLRIAFPTAFFEPHQLGKALFTGCYLNKRLLACAGFHVLSYGEGVGVLGSIATHPDHRGRGLAASATRRLMEEVEGSIPLLALNVHVHNTPAVALYRNLGFEEAFSYREASAKRL